MIEVKGLSRVHRDHDGTAVPVLQQVDLAIEAGAFVALVGRSGSGKTTLLNILGGLDSAFTGEVVVAGQRLGALDDQALSTFRNRHLGFVFQSFHLVAGMTAQENVALPSLFSPDPGPDAVARARECLTQVGLETKVHRRPDELSGGERQRVAIARALFMKPRLLLADEPTGNLDAATAEEVGHWLSTLHQQGLTVVLATHDERVATLAQRRVRLEAGRVA